MGRDFVSWERYFTAVDSLYASLSSAAVTDLKPRAIVAPSRGGLTLGVMLSHRLKLPLVCFDPKENYPAWSRFATKTLIFVDDISDTGVTLARVIQDSASWDINWVTATVFVKAGTLVMPNHWVEVAQPLDWIVFPYEDDEEHPLISSTQRSTTLILAS